MRSLLFVPGDSERKLEKGLQSGADVLLLDLEDSVAVANKPAARETVAAALQRPRPAGTPRLFVRINDMGTGLAEDDLRTVLRGAPDGIMLPKCEGAADVQRLSVMLRVAEAENGIADGATRIIAIMTETARAMLAVSTLTGPLPRLAGVTWGSEDLSADIGASSYRDQSGGYTDLFRMARSFALLAATTTESTPIDSVFTDFRDEAGLEAECRNAERDGFTAKMAIHPGQVEVINRVFTPDPDTLAEARALVEAFVAAGNPGVLGIGGRMYDRPHLRRAERLLARTG